MELDADEIEAIEAIRAVKKEGDGYGTVTVRVCGRNIVHINKGFDKDLTK